jgi:hypothetical protein
MHLVVKLKIFNSKLSATLSNHHDLEGSLGFGLHTLSQLSNFQSTLTDKACI